MEGRSRYTVTIIIIIIVVVVVVVIIVVIVVAKPDEATLHVLRNGQQCSYLFQKFWKG